MAEAAPGLFSTMKLCFNFSCSFSATSRARMSLVPPGGKPTTIFTGLSG